MTLQSIKDALPEYAKDTKLNLGKILSEDGVEGLSQTQSGGITLASAYATRDARLIGALEAHLEGALDTTTVTAAKAAASIMAMNNVYYRFVHLVSDKSYGQMPANLRMNVIGNPGIDKVDFELMALAVSAINGCGMCIDAHVHEVTKAGVTKQGVQSAIRIAAVINAVAQTLATQAAASQSATASSSAQAA